MIKKSLPILSVFYLVAGINHFWNPGFYEPIMPPFLPYHLTLIYISGACEIIFAILLLPRSTRKTAAWLIIIFLIAVFPANIQMAVNYYSENDPRLWFALVRLPLQAVLILWAHVFTKVIKH